jgi:RecA/RadA recombinase
MAKEPLSKEERQKLLEARLKSIGSLDKIVKGDAFDSRHQDYIPLGIPEIESQMGDLPGFMTGNLIELIGESGSGKTYVALKTAAQAQKKGMKVAFFNIENSFYEKRANQIGVITRDPELFQMIPNLGSGEDVCDTVCAMVESGLYGLIIVDSVTALIPNDSLEKSFGDARKIGEHAKLVGELAKKLTYLTGEHNTAVILINQFRIGSGAMPNTFVKKATGGEGLYFYDHYRFSFKKIGGAAGAIYNAEKQVIGGKTELTMNKIRYAPPNTKLIFPIYFTEEDSNPVVDFLMRAKARNVELIKEVGAKSKKRYQYITEDGEVIESADVKEFINKLMSTPAPTKRTRNDLSNSAFEFICRKIKFDEKMVSEMLEKLEEDVSFETPNELIGYTEEANFDESSD